MISVEKPGTPYELVHHGVKGMRWGIRNQKAASEHTPKSKRKPLLKGKKAVAFNSAVAIAVVAVGAAFVAYMLKSGGSTPIPPPSKTAEEWAAEFLDIAKKNNPNLF